jgi:hypothetical protein
VLATALLAASESVVPAAPMLAMLAMGVVIAMYGHAAHSYRIVAIGLTLLFLATALMLIGAFIAYKRGERDPRPPGDYLSIVVDARGRGL